jgi:hypothetical protein
MRRFVRLVLSDAASNKRLNNPVAILVVGREPSATVIANAFIGLMSGRVRSSGLAAMFIGLQAPGGERERIRGAHRIDGARTTSAAKMSPYQGGRRAS